MHETNLQGEEAAELWPCHDPLIMHFPTRVPESLGCFTLYALPLTAAWSSGRDPHCYSNIAGRD